MNIILFDIDGTLIYMRSRPERDGCGVVEQGTLDADPSEVQYSGRTDKSIIRDHLRLFGIEETPDNFATYREIFYNSCRRSWRKSRAASCQESSKLWKRLADTPFELGLITGNSAPLRR